MGQFRRKISRKTYHPQQKDDNTTASNSGSNHTGSFFTSFLGSWQLWLACLTALVYMLGYYRALLLFSALDIFITPTEVYDLSSLFTWGITTIIASMPMGIIASVMGYLLSKVLLVKKPWHFIAIALVFYLVFRIFYTWLPWLANYNPIGFMFVPSRTLYTNWYYIFSTYWLWNSIVLSAIVLMSFLFFKTQNKYVIPAYIVCLLAWIFLLTSTQYYDFKHITGGGAINSVSQYPGMNGLIITNTRVAFAGKAVPEFGGTAYGMWGLLLSRHAGEYYFVPGIVANEYSSGNVEVEISYKYGDVVIIPEKNVITFLKRKSETFDFIGVNPPPEQ
jgi:hypothetical protein